MKILHLTITTTLTLFLSVFVLAHAADIRVVVDPRNDNERFSLTIKNNSASSAIESVELEAKNAEFDWVNVTGINTSPDLGSANNDGVLEKSILLTPINPLKAGDSSLFGMGDIDGGTGGFDVTVNFADGGKVSGTLKNVGDTDDDNSDRFEYHADAPTKTNPSSPPPPSTQGGSSSLGATIVVDPLNVNDRFDFTVTNHSDRNRITEVILEATKGTVDWVEATQITVQPNLGTKNNDGISFETVTFNFDQPLAPNAFAFAKADADNAPRGYNATIRFDNGESISGSLKNIGDSDDTNSKYYIFTGFKSPQSNPAPSGKPTPTNNPATPSNTPNTERGYRITLDPLNQNDRFALQMSNVDATLIPTGFSIEAIGGRFDWVDFGSLNVSPELGENNDGRNSETVTFDFEGSLSQGFMKIGRGDIDGDVRGFNITVNFADGSKASGAMRNVGDIDDTNSDYYVFGDTRSLVDDHSNNGGSSPPPPPPPPPSSKPSPPTSTKFVPSDRVVLNGDVNVRRTAGGTKMGEQSTGSVGTIVSGPLNGTLPSGNTFIYYEVNFDSGIDGWVSRSRLDLLSSSPSPVSSGVGKKWNPGHYLLTTGNESKSDQDEYREELTNQIRRRINDSDVIIGATVRYNWGAIEERRGVYDFSMIDEHINEVAKHGKKLIFEVGGKCNSSDCGSLAPNDMSNDIAFIEHKGDYQIATWEPDVMDRLLEFNDALAQRYDDNPTIESVSLSNENCTGKLRGLPGYSDSGYAAQVNRLIDRMGETWEKTNVYYKLNCDPRDEFVGVLENIYDNGTGRGSPDAHDDPGARLFRGENGAVRDYRSKIPHNLLVSSPNLGNKDDILPLSNITKRILDNDVTHVSWYPHEKDAGARWEDIVDHLESNPDIHDRCPSQYLRLFGGCQGDNTSPPPPPPPPPPSPKPTPSPTAKFNIGDRVQTTSNLNVRDSANGTWIGVQSPGSIGTIVGGPGAGKNHGAYYDINYDSGADGWSHDDWLVLVTPAPTPAPSGDAEIVKIINFESRPLMNTRQDFKNRGKDCAHDCATGSWQSLVDNYNDNLQIIKREEGPVRAGERAVKLQIDSSRPDLYVNTPSGKGYNKPRSDIATGNGRTPDALVYYEEDVWVGWSFYYPEDHEFGKNASNWGVGLSEWQRATDSVNLPCPTAAADKVFSMSEFEDSLIVDLHHSTSKANCEAGVFEKTEYTLVNKIERGKWYDIVVHSNVCANPNKCDPIFEIWVDGQKVVNHTDPVGHRGHEVFNGEQNRYKVDISYYAHHELYDQGANYTRSKGEHGYYLDEFRIAKGSNAYALVDPASYSSGASTPPSISSQDKFEIGDRVEATDTLNVRQTPNGTKLGTQGQGGAGTIIGGPITAGPNNGTWWQVNYDSSPDGWSHEDWLIDSNKSVPTSPPPPPPPPPPPSSSTSGLDVYPKRHADGSIIPSRIFYVAKNGNNSNNGASPGSPWKTISRANSALRPGDQVLIREGEYNEQIRPARSGSSGNYISYKSYPGETAVITDVSEDNAIDLSDRSYIHIEDLRIDGKEIYRDANIKHWLRLSNSDHNIIHHNIFKFATGWAGIKVTGGSEENKFLNNQVSYIGSYIRTSPDGNGVEDSGDMFVLSCGFRNLIEGNDMSFAGHDMLHLNGSENIARGNQFSNKWTDTHGNRVGTINSRPSDCSTLGRNVYENNFIFDSFKSIDSNSTAAFKVEGLDHIVRNNVVTRTWQSAMSTNGRTKASPVSDGLRIYHNTYHDLGGPVWDIHYTNEATYNDLKFENNLISDARQNPVSPETDVEFREKRDFDEVEISSNNFYGNSSTLISTTQGQVKTLNQIENEEPDRYFENKELNPRFVSSNPKNYNDFELRSSSALKDAGNFLTEARSSGSGKTLQVEDANYFIDGFGIVDGDTIQIEGDSRTAKVVDVNYGNNTLTLSNSLSWSKGDGVSLKYSGNAPSIGAFE